MTKSEFIDWKSHPVTVEMVEIFSEVREALVEALVAGTDLSNPTEAAKKVGQVQGLDFLLRAEYEGEEEDA